MRKLTHLRPDGKGNWEEYQLGPDDLHLPVGYTEDQVWSRKEFERIHRVVKELSARVEHLEEQARETE